jgi:hypothetical protein
MSRLSIGIFALLLTATPLVLVGTTGPALALCKPGTKHCTTQGPNLGRFQNTVGNAGDCVGTTNDTCGFKTHAARVTPTTPTTPQPTGSAGRR